MHALCSHVPELLALYGKIEYFTQQGMEKYNDITLKNFFRSTDHRGVCYQAAVSEKKPSSVPGGSWFCKSEKKLYL